MPARRSVPEPPRLARAPQENDRAREQCQSDREEEEPGPVLAAGADRARVRDREARSFESEHAQDRREDGPPAGAQARIADGCQSEQGE